MRKFTKYKAVVRNKETKEYTILECEATSKRIFIQDIRANGYSVDRNKVKEAKLFNYIMEHTDATPQDWKLKEAPLEK